MEEGVEVWEGWESEGCIILLRAAVMVLFDIDFRFSYCSC